VIVAAGAAGRVFMVSVSRQFLEEKTLSPETENRERA
jgi:hypothetical protein